MGTYDTSAAGIGYIATYDPSTKKVTKLTANGFESPRGLTPLGMDVVPSTRNPDELTIYVINMRPPFVDLDPDLPPGVREVKRDEIASARSKKEGADQSIEVFRYVLGGESMQYVATWTDEKILIAPNDLVGLPDGKGCWFTNPIAHRIGIVRLKFFRKYSQSLTPISLGLEQSNEVSMLLQQKVASIGFCGVDGCKFATTGLYGINGIARSPFPSNDTFYVAHTLLGGVSLLTRQSDNRLLLDEHIDTGERTPNHTLTVDH